MGGIHIKNDQGKSKTPTLDTYTAISEPHPEYPDVRRFIIPGVKLIINNPSAPEGKIDMIIPTDMGGYEG